MSSIAKRVAEKVTAQAGQMVNVSVTGEDEEGDYVVQMTAEDAKRARELLKEGADSGDWPEEVNTILDRSPKIKTIGTINTAGNWGWYDPDEWPD